jgi:hypothetical protein
VVGEVGRETYIVAVFLTEGRIARCAAEVLKTHKNTVQCTTGPPL